MRLLYDTPRRFSSCARRMDTAGVWYESQGIMTPNKGVIHNMAAEALLCMRIRSAIAPASSVSVCCRTRENGRGRHTSGNACKVLWSSGERGSSGGDS